MSGFYLNVQFLYQALCSFFLSMQYLARSSLKDEKYMQISEMMLDSPAMHLFVVVSLSDGILVRKRYISEASVQA